MLNGLLAGALRDGLALGRERQPGRREIFGGLYVQALGVLFLLSYWFSEHGHILKFLMWLCENHSTPRGAWTAILWGMFGIGFGFVPLLIGLGVMRP